MDFRSRAFSLEDEGKLRKLTYIRLVIATLVMGAAIAAMQLDNRFISVVAMYSLLGAIYLTTGSSYILFRTGAPLRPILWIQICIDMVVLTMMVHYSGGSGSYFAMLYILPIIVGGVHFFVPGGITTAALASMIYVIYTFLEISGYIQYPLGMWFGASYGVYKTMLVVYLNIAAFFFAGILSGYVSRHVRKKGQALADSEKKLRRVQLNTDNILENMSSGLIVTNMSGDVLSLNPAAVAILEFGTAEEIKVMRIDDIASRMPALAQELSRALETGKSRKRHEIEVNKVDGSALPLGISISILKDEKGEKRGIIALFQDLTEVHRMREMVRQADKMAAIGRLSAAIAHEIRAPLASICGSIEMLGEELEPGGENRMLMDLVLRESDRLDGIITDFLEFAKPRTPHLAPVDVGRCTGEVVELMRHSSSLRQDVAISIINEAKGAHINADDEQIRQVFLNVGLNACEATADGGEISVVIRKRSDEFCNSEQVEDCISIEFINSGKPIAEKTLGRVFEPFFTTKEGGTGLGLAIAEKIVESHRGRISVQSTGTGITTFSIILPAAIESGKERESVITEETVSY